MRLALCDVVQQRLCSGTVTVTEKAYSSVPRCYLNRKTRKARLQKKKQLFQCQYWCKQYEWPYEVKCGRDLCPGAAMVAKKAYKVP